MISNQYIKNLLDYSPLKAIIEVLGFILLGFIAFISFPFLLIFIFYKKIYEKKVKNSFYKRAKS